MKLGLLQWLRSERFLYSSEVLIELQAIPQGSNQQTGILQCVDDISQALPPSRGGALCEYPLSMRLILHRSIYPPNCLPYQQT